MRKILMFISVISMFSLTVGADLIVEPHRKPEVPQGPVSHCTEASGLIIPFVVLFFVLACVIIYLKKQHKQEDTPS